MQRGVREFVRRRAGGVCEYCLFPEERSRLSYHIEHIVARQHGGGDDIENLALACHRCNLHEGPNLSGVDPGTGSRLFCFIRERIDGANISFAAVLSSTG